MKAKHSIKKKGVFLTLAPSFLKAANLSEEIGNNYYYRHNNNNTWEKFVDKMKELNTNPFISSIETYYRDEIETSNFNFDNHALKSGDNIYFIPGTAVPRFKVKEKGDSVGFKTKKSYENANVFVLDDKSLKKLSLKRSPFENRIVYTNFCKFVEHIGLDVSTLLPEEERELAQNTNEIYFSNYLSTIVTNLNTETTEEIISLNRWVKRDYHREEFFNEESKKLLNLINDVCYDPKKILISGSMVLEQLNDSTSIDEKMYNRLNQMLSSDTASIELAMDLMCNVDLKKSLFYILLIIKDHSQKIRWSNTYGHSNFKAFRQSMDDLMGSSRDRVFHYNYTGFEIIDALGKLKMLKKEHVDYFKEDIKNSFAYSLYKEFFNVSKIEATDKLKKMLIASAENLKEDEPV